MVKSATDLFGSDLVDLKITHGLHYIKILCACQAKKQLCMDFLRFFTFLRFYVVNARGKKRKAHGRKVKNSDSIINVWGTGRYSEKKQ